MAINIPSESEEIEASGDAIVIAAAIHDLAAAVREFAKIVKPEGDEDEQTDIERYMDGTPVHA